MSFSIKTVTLGTCRPYVILKEEGQSGSRIGGNPPEGVGFAKGEHTQYFMTLPFDTEANQYCSVFLHFDTFPGVQYERNSEKESDLMSSDDGLIEFVLHEDREQSWDAKYRSQVSSHRIEVLPEIRDTSGDRFSGTEAMLTGVTYQKKPEALACEPWERVLYFPSTFKDIIIAKKCPIIETNAPYAGTKLGGTSGHDIIEYPHIQQTVKELYADGYVHFLQWNGFRPENWSISGNQPFIENTVSVFVKQGAEPAWKFFWIF